MDDFLHTDLAKVRRVARDVGVDRTGWEKCPDGSHLRLRRHPQWRFVSDLIYVSVFADLFRVAKERGSGLRMLCSVAGGTHAFIDTLLDVGGVAQPKVATTQLDIAEMFRGNMTQAKPAAKKAKGRR